jgi:hypothetical protein
MNKLREEIKKDAQRYSDDPTLQKAYEDGANEALQKYPVVPAYSMLLDLNLLDRLPDPLGKDYAISVSRHRVRERVFDELERQGFFKLTEKVQNGILEIECKAVDLRVLDDPREGGSHD